MQQPRSSHLSGSMGILESWGDDGMKLAGRKWIDIVVPFTYCQGCQSRVRYSMFVALVDTLVRNPIPYGVQYSVQ